MGTTIQVTAPKIYMDSGTTTNGSSFFDNDPYSYKSIPIPTDQGARFVPDLMGLNYRGIHNHNHEIKYVMENYISHIQNPCTYSLVFTDLGGNARLFVHAYEHFYQAVAAIMRWTERLAKDNYRVKLSDDSACVVITASIIRVDNGVELENQYSPPDEVARFHLENTSQVVKTITKGE